MRHRAGYLPALLAAVLLATAFSPAPRAGADDDSRGYYLDTGCDRCIPREGDEPGAYWILTDGVCSASPEDFDAIVATFRDALSDSFAAAEDLLPTVVLRFRDTPEQAETGRAAKRERMTERGYAVIEISFPCPETGRR